jgi:5-methylcytosine-specific restriction endonuclease McrA
MACAYCGRRCVKKAPRSKWKTEASIDHVQPLSRGGTNDPANLVVACKGCNEDKGDRLIGEARVVVTTGEAGTSRARELARQIVSGGVSVAA